MIYHDEYRFAAIEKRLDKLDQVHEIVTRLDERLGKFAAVYDQRITAVEGTQEKQGKDVDDLKTFKWKAVGTIGLAMVIISIFGSAIGNAIVKKATTSNTPSKETSYFETSTNDFSFAKNPIRILTDADTKHPPQGKH
jgi:hypothetical protein